MVVHLEQELDNHVVISSTVVEREHGVVGFRVVGSQAKVYHLLKRGLGNAQGAVGFARVQESVVHVKVPLLQGNGVQELAGFFKTIKFSNQEKPNLEIHRRQIVNLLVTHPLRNLEGVGEAVEFVKGGDDAPEF